MVYTESFSAAGTPSTMTEPLRILHDNRTKLLTYGLVSYSHITTRSDATGVVTEVNESGRARINHVQNLRGFPRLASLALAT